MEESKSKRCLLEICVDTVRDVRHAFAFGADRVEYCEDLSIDGITPAADNISTVCSQNDGDIVILIRPRSGDFVYSQDEFESMQQSIHVAKAAGATGIAIGALTPARQLDIELLKMAVQTATGVELIMHRAFDGVEDPFLALDQLVDLGFDRILTSGLKPSAVLGTPTLRSLVDRARKRIEVIAAGNVRSANAQWVIENSGVQQIHSSARMPTTVADGDGASSMSFDEVRALAKIVRHPVST